MAGPLSKTRAAFEPQAAEPDWVNPWDAQIAAQLEKINALKDQPRYTPEEVAQRRARNQDEYQLGLLGLLSGDDQLGQVGGQVFKNALAQRQERITEKGVADPISGAFSYDPDYLRQQEAGKLDALQKLQVSAQLKRDADMREAQLKRELAAGGAETRVLLKSLGAAGNQGANDARTWRGEDTLRGDFDKLTKDSRDELSSIGKLQATLGAYAGRRFDPIAQQSAVILLNKFLDPGSVVREGEFNRVVEAQGLEAQARMALDRVLKGDILGPEVVQQIGKLATVYQAAAESSIRKHAKNYSEIAQRRKFDPANVITDQRWLQEPTAPAPPAPAVPGTATGANGWSIKVKQ